MMDKRHNVVLLMHISHTEMKGGILFLNKIGNKYFKYWKLGWPNM